MKKLLIATMLLSSTYLIHATQTEVQDQNENTEQQEQPEELNELDTLEQENIDAIAKNIGIIRFTITLYKDRDNHDVSEWQRIVTKAAQSIYRLQNEYTDSSNILKELNEIVNTLQNNQHDNGIAGELVVEASDGQPMQDCCGINCKCADMYRGNCSCSLNNARSNRCIPLEDETDENDDNSDERAEESFEDVDLNKSAKIKNNCCC